MKNIATMFVMMTMLASLFGAFFVAMPSVHALTFAEDSLDQLESVGTAATYEATGQNTLPQTIGRIIKIVLGFLGIVLIVIVIYAGFLWMTAGGESKGVEAAQTLLKNSIIGLAIILSAYAITDFVIKKLMGAVTGVEILP
ncbi:MAG: hypothetical protein AAB575_00295 [Patescibacteria group bacterium]